MVRQKSIGEWRTIQLGNAPTPHNTTTRTKRFDSLSCFLLLHFVVLDKSPNQQSIDLFEDPPTNKRKATTTNRHSFSQNKISLPKTIKEDKIDGEEEQQKKYT